MKVKNYNEIVEHSQSIFIKDKQTNSAPSEEKDELARETFWVSDSVLVGLYSMLVKNHYDFKRCAL